MNSLISVLVAAYNVEDYIVPCLESIINQTYRELEIIVVDDGSTDSTCQIIDEYAMKDSRIKVIHKNNEGLVMARRTALGMAGGEYAGFVDGDDWIDENMYRRLIDVMQRTKADIVASGRILEENNKSIVLNNLIGEGEYCPLIDEKTCRKLIWDENNNLWGITPNFTDKLFKTDYIRERQKKVNPEITYGEDDACVYGALAFANKIAVIGEAFYHHRMRSDSMSHSADDLYMHKINLLYLDFRESISGHPFEAILKSGLDLYMLEFVRRGIDGLWGIQVDYSVVPYLYTGFDLHFDEKFVLYGAGQVGRDMHREFTKMGLENNIIWVDKNYQKYNRLGYKVEGQERLGVKDYKSIIVAVRNEDTFAEVCTELTQMGIEPNTIQRAQLTSAMNLCKRL